MTDRQRSDTLGSFLAWRQSRLATATTEDVVEAANRLIDISGGGRVSASHIDELLAHYRRRFAGPRAIVMAQAVADDFCVFQDSQLDADVSPQAMPGIRTAPDDDRDAGGALGSIELDLDGDDLRGSDFRQRFHLPGLASSVPPAPATSSAPPPPSADPEVPPPPALPNIGTPSDRPPTPDAPSTPAAPSNLERPTLST